MTERGVIKNRAFKNQVSNFSGLKFGKITPTDIDCFLEFHNELFIFVEAKYNIAELKLGQLVAFERICDGLNNHPVTYSYFIIADHNTPAEQDIDFSSMKIRLIRQNNKWTKPKTQDLTVRDAIYAMIKFVKDHKGLENLNVVDFIKPNITYIDILNLYRPVWSERSAQGGLF